MDEFSYLTEILKQRVLILDGAMGTMLQRRHLTEADFRGDRFKDLLFRLVEHRRGRQGWGHV